MTSTCYEHDDDTTIMTRDKISINIDIEGHRILAKLAQMNYRTKQAQLKVILLEEAKRNGIDLVEVSAKQ